MGELVPKSEPLTGSAHLHPGHLSPQPGEAEKRSSGAAEWGAAHVVQLPEDTREHLLEETGASPGNTWELQRSLEPGAACPTPEPHAPGAPRPCHAYDSGIRRVQPGALGAGRGRKGGVPARGGGPGAGAERRDGRRPPAEPGPGPRTCRLQRLWRRRRARIFAHGSSGSSGSGGPDSGRDGRAAALEARGARDLTS
ncbi:unnamed protein product [Rangifer tarandus platyrhynchus]|uniref:Uncharacterized protein n=2 Tax=Rangifer tarandus platyrhynchus TaxID=3082113 RepID=A0ABN8YPV5_RANTA|nr:unnamed protein product [Rangifer tarandus platyrhynchus]CAI9700621.1 unnamed protein product [Rangifer tarandus platyrhynchus]